MLVFIDGAFIERYVRLPPCIHEYNIHIEIPQNKK